MFNTIYGFDNQVLKYDVIPDNATYIDFPSEAGQMTVINDPIDLPGVATNINFVGSNTDSGIIRSS